MNSENVRMFLHSSHWMMLIFEKRFYFFKLSKLTEKMKENVPKVVTVSPATYVWLWRYFSLARQKHERQATSKITMSTILNTVHTVVRSRHTVHTRTCRGVGELTLVLSINK